MVWSSIGIEGSDLKFSFRFLQIRLYREKLDLVVLIRTVNINSNQSRFLANDKPQKDAPGTNKSCSYIQYCEYH